MVRFWHIIMLMQKKYLLVTYKVLFGILGLSAIATEIYALTINGRFNFVNFFSFFTVESNLFAATMLIVSACMVRKWQTKLLLTLRGAATLYMVTTGIVFSVLLSGLEATVLTAVPWDNIVLHYIMPIAVLADWLFDPPKSRIRFKNAIVWLVYPFVYVAYSLIRGQLVGWYPYPFLNPDTNGYIGIVVTSIGIAATILILTWILCLVREMPLKKKAEVM
jgi:hypothetical protein